MERIKSLKYAEELHPKLIKMFGSAENLDKLAKDNLVPHYVLVNPFDKSEQYLFIQKELSEWYESNCIFQRLGIAELIPKFHTFISPSNQSILPPELVSAKGIQELPLHLINTPPGVYFLCMDAKIVYIGQAANVAGRIHAHLSAKEKVFNQVFYLPVPLSQLTEIETSFIRNFKPEYNRSGLGKIDQNNISVLERYGLPVITEQNK